MNSALKLIVNKYGWIHLSLGLFGNITFFVGSIMFLPAFKENQTLGVWLFIIGSFFMFIGSLGRLLVDITDNRHAD